MEVIYRTRSILCGNEYQSSAWDLTTLESHLSGLGSRRVSHRYIYFGNILL